MDSRDVTGDCQRPTSLRTAIFCLLAFTAGFALAAEPTHSAGTTRNSSNFCVYGARTVLERAQITLRCQEIRDELHTRWNGDAEQIAWKPVCEIVLHPTLSAYLGAVGAGGRGTVGATYIQFDPRQPERILRRRVDLLTAGQSDPLSALPHEMTHVLLADRFKGTQPPPWLDEGIATMADSHTKQKRHLLDLRTVASRQGRQSVAEMLSHDGPIPSHQRARFYGQSVALATILTRIDAPARIFEFASEAERTSPEKALRAIYKLEMYELDRRIADLTLESDVAQQ